MNAPARPTFAHDVARLSAHVRTIVLSHEGSPARLAVVPAYQGRVMTSSARGDDGASLGFVNAELVAQGLVLPHINPVGGEDRLWIGPEGGQFGFFFAPGSAFTYERWQTPPALDTEPFALVRHDAGRVELERTMRLVNWSGVDFTLRLHREIVLHDDAQARASLRAPSDDLAVVAFESRNTLVNAGDRPWTRATGLPSLWVLGMFPPGERTCVVVPVAGDTRDARGPMVNDDYFGAVGASRLRVHDGIVSFRADGRQRGKIGIPPRRALGVAGAWDAATGTLTLVTSSAPRDAVEYVDSTWRRQSDPFAGDALHAYNDGPVAGGDPIAGFYEIETSSPALALEPGASHTHVHRTIHAEGDRAQLDAVARATLGIGLDAIERTFAPAS